MRCIDKRKASITGCQPERLTLAFLLTVIETAQTLTTEGGGFQVESEKFTDILNGFIVVGNHLLHPQNRRFQSLH